MIVVADSGSTKADWVLIDNEATHAIHTMGFNPIYHSEELISGEVKRGFTAAGLPVKSVKALYYYGTAIWDEEKAAKVARALATVFPAAHIEVEHDLLGAARSTCGHEAGISCIIGTGSNTCYFDGKEVVDNVTNLGYFIGDEGSGAHLGKELIRAYFYRELPAVLCEALEKEVPGGKTEILDNVYSKPSPNVYLAKFTQFLGANRDHFFIQQLIYKSFAEFIDRHVRKYANHQSVPIHFIGSVAFHFQDFLRIILEERSMVAGNFIHKPIDTLVRYHQAQHQ